MLNNYNCYNNISLTSKYSRASLKTENNTMNENRFTSENAWYHFALGDIVQAIALYGVDTVMTDIYDKLFLENVLANKQDAVDEARKSYLNPELRTYDGRLE